MSDEDDASKTEDPTSKKLEDAREKGQVAVSKEISSWFALLGGLLVIGVFGVALCKELYRLLRPFLEKPHEIQPDTGGLANVLSYLVAGVGFALIIPVMIFVGFAFLSNYMQNGILFAPEAIAPKLQNISPIKGMKQIFSLKGFVEFLKGIFKITIIGILLTVLLWPELSRLEEIMQLEPVSMLEEIRWMLIKLLGGAVAVMAVIAFADLMYQRYQFTKDMRMTKQEVRDEYKQAEGDPHVKGRLRNLRMQRARQRMMAAVPSATVVVTNPTHYAVAIKYERDSMEAPMVVAKGVDAVALRIREVAEENKIPIVENPPVARLLYATVDLDHEIKPEQYQAVAEIITYIFRLDKAKGAPMGAPPGGPQGGGARAR